MNTIRYKSVTYTVWRPAKTAYHVAPWRQPKTTYHVASYRRTEVRVTRVRRNNR